MNDNTGITEVTTAIQTSMEDLWIGIIEVLPQVSAALIVFVLGLIIAPILGHIVRKLINLTKIDSLAEKSGVAGQAEGAGMPFTISGIIGGFVKWFILIAFIVAAVDILQWERLSDLLYELLFFIPHVIVAVVILAVGLIIGNLLERLIVKKIEISKVLIKNGAMLGKMAKWSVVTFATLIALFQLGIAEELIMILFAGLVLALSLAFGLGGREKASQFLSKLDSSQ